MTKKKPEETPNQRFARYMEMALKGEPLFEDGEVEWVDVHVDFAVPNHNRTHPNEPHTLPWNGKAPVVKDERARRSKNRSIDEQGRKFRLNPDQENIVRRLLKRLG